MPNGSSPKYKYRPPVVPKTAHLRTCSSRRGRLWEGGTYFRSRDTGLRTNNISIEVTESAPNVDGYCVVTNVNIKNTENVVGNVNVDLLDLNGTYQDLWIIDQLDTTPRVRYYSISCQIRFLIQSSLPYTLPAPTELGNFAFDKLFTHSGKLSVKMSKKTPGFTSADRIFITPRVRIHPLSLITKDIGTEPSTPEFVTGWDIDALRSSMNATNPWVEMVERTFSSPSTPGGPPVENPDPADVQDDGGDSDFLSPFYTTRLASGDGLPGNPNSEKAGPERSIVHLNYSELQNGSLGVHNVVYEWVGDNAISGAWQPY